MSKYETRLNVINQKLSSMKLYVFLLTRTPIRQIEEEVMELPLVMAEVAERRLSEWQNTRMR